MSTASTAMRRRAAAAVAALRSRSGRLHTSGPPVDEPLRQAMKRDAEDFGHMQRLLAFVLARDANCIDVGANRGAVLAEMLRVAPDGRHIAFEPLPHLCDRLRSAFPGVDVRQAALYDEPGEAGFSYVHGSAEGWSGLRFRPLPSGEQAEVEQIRVRLEVLDDVLDPDYRPAVIKIDVEGAELQVLRGALRTLRRHRPVLIFEHGTGSAEAYGTSPRGLFELLRDQAGFRIFDLDGGGPYALDEFERVFYAAERVNFVAHA